MTPTATLQSVTNTGSPLPRLGFVGTGWIGRLRMEALLDAECAECCVVHDADITAARTAAGLATGTRVSHSFDELLRADDIDGLVIATPSALHAQHCEQALAHDKAVFCQKPLARTTAETRRVVEAARAADKRLAVDFSYRHLAGMAQLYSLINSAELGDIFAADLVFHNAYGPDKSWFYDVKAAGGGCVMDLGIHLVDLALWLLPGREVGPVRSTLFQRGKKLAPPYTVVEDFAQADFSVDDTQVRLCCSWNLHAGRDAVIEATFHGTRGGVSVRNVGGSFFDFEIHRFDGTASRQLAGYPDAWGGRALTAWARALADSTAFDPQVEEAVRVAEVIDRIYQR